MIFDIGRVCVKIAGRDAGKYAVVVDHIDDKHVLIDGQTRRRKCNVSHIEPVVKTVSIKKGASTQDVVKALADADIVVEKKGTAKKPASRPKKAHKSNNKKQ